MLNINISNTHYRKYKIQKIINLGNTRTQHTRKSIQTKLFKNALHWKKKNKKNIKLKQIMLHRK